MFKIEGNIDNVVARIEKISPDAHANLEKTVDNLKDRLVIEVKARTPVRSGALRASIVGELHPGATGVSGQVSANPTGGESKGSRRWYYAIWVEYGAHIPAHKIVPSVAQVLAIHQADGKTIFAKSVMTKPADLRAQQPIHGAFKEMRKEILSDLRKAVEEAL